MTSLQDYNIFLAITSIELPALSILASYPGSLIIVGEEKRAWFQSLVHATHCSAKQKHMFIIGNTDNGCIN